MIKYDFKIIQTFNDVLGEDAMFNLSNNVSDYDMLRIATELLIDATERLNSDLDDEKIMQEYNKLVEIILELQDIIKNYV